ncbi:uncharacterized protein LAJ45_04626 [Morchella importuna]|uniref:uncharacterized protein n=1 Tax=Morchella importuna TaxID=1174673 RepID=UPI001E8ED5C8|nr:uncharacterized protein LAJ45_04626 [Morchella importuna]KAH8151421.1 hypothetical protein LAJ45_04626 [Morchella importuna]
MHKDLELPSLNPPLPSSPASASKAVGALTLKSPKRRCKIGVRVAGVPGSADRDAEMSTAQGPALGAARTTIDVVELALNARAAAAGDDTVFEVSSDGDQLGGEGRAGTGLADGVAFDGGGGGGESEEEDGEKEDGEELEHFGRLFSG